MSTSASIASPAARGRDERRHIRRHARSHHHGGRPRDALEIVAAELDGGPERHAAPRPSASNAGPVPVSEA